MCQLFYVVVREMLIEWPLFGRIWRMMKAMDGVADEFGSEVRMSNRRCDIGCRVGKCLSIEVLGTSEKGRT